MEQDSLILLSAFVTLSATNFILLWRTNSMSSKQYNSLRTEIGGQISSLRTEQDRKFEKVDERINGLAVQMNAGHRALAKEMDERINGLAAQMNAGFMDSAKERNECISGLTKEMHEHISGLKSEMHAGHSNLSNKISFITGVVYSGPLRERDELRDYPVVPASVGT